MSTLNRVFFCLKSGDSFSVKCPPVCSVRFNKVFLSFLCFSFSVSFSCHLSFSYFSTDFVYSCRFSVLFLHSFSRVFLYYAVSLLCFVFVFIFLNDMVLFLFCQIYYFSLSVSVQFYCSCSFTFNSFRFHKLLGYFSSIVLFLITLQFHSPLVFMPCFVSLSI